MPIPDGTPRYFDGVIYLLSMLITAGEFRAW